MTPTCLLIDDDLDDQEIFCLALRRVDPAIECMLAKDGYEGLEKLHRLNGPIQDYIFIDLNMPRLNGMDTMSEILKLYSDQKPTVVMYSTSSEKKLIDEAILKGANHFIVKPATIGELVTTLRGILSSDK